MKTSCGRYQGLFLGKPLGITAFSWLAAGLKLASRPEGTSWTQIFGASWLCGIGFTMSLVYCQLSVWRRTQPRNCESWHNIRFGAGRVVRRGYAPPTHHRLKVDDGLRAENSDLRRRGEGQLTTMSLMNFPILVFASSLFVLAMAAAIGDALRNWVTPLKEEDRNDFGVVLGATLTLLGLLIGFSFSMAVSRYDQRKNYEEAEANAIGTEYVRADLLPNADGENVRELLKKYLDQRISFYTTLDRDKLAKINGDTTELQNELWSAVRPGAATQPTPVVALAVSGMNDVLNSQGYTQAAWWNRIPIAAWALMAIIAICCNLLIGYGAHRRDWRMFLIVPVAVSIAFAYAMSASNGGS